MKIEKIKFKSAGYELVGEIDSPNYFKSKLPTVILFHGLTNSRKGCPLINETAEALTEAGFLVFRFDFYGSGESLGELRDKTVDILEQNAKDAVKFIINNPGVDRNRLGLWGRSTGGTLVCLLEKKINIKARVSLSAEIAFEKETFKFKQIINKEFELEKQGKKLPGTGKYKGPFEFNKNWYKSFRGLDKKIKNNLKNLDTILILGTSRDQKVTLDNACKIVNSVKEPKRIWIFPTDHDYAGFEKEAVEESVSWFKKYL